MMAASGSLVLLALIALIVAAAAAKLGLDCHLAVYHGRLKPPGPVYETSGNIALNRLFGATQAGLAVRAAACLPECAVIGIDIDAELERIRADVVRYATAAAEMLDVPFDAARIDVVAGHASPAYGVPHQATLDAIKFMGQLEALALDPVYSGKDLAGLIALIEAGCWTPDDDIVFVHTGGAPALFAYPDIFSH